MHAFAALLAASFVLLCQPAPSQAQTPSEDQARRQLDYAKEELADGRYERARKSADSAFLLDPTLYDALVLLALSHEGLGNLRMAESLLMTYIEFTNHLQTDPEAQEALERIGSKLGAGRQLAVEGSEVGQEAGDESSESESEDSGGTAVGEGAEIVRTAGQIELRRELLLVRRDAGLGLLIGGLALGGAGGGIMAAMSAASVGGNPSPTVSSVYGAGLASVFSGVTLVVVGMPLTISGGQGLARLTSEDEQLAFVAPRRVVPRLRFELRGGGGGLSLAF